MARTASPRVTTATSQSVSRAFLDPFGEKQAGSGSDPRHLFTDQERDAETGLDYFGARYYDAWVGRFLEQDPELLGAVEGITFACIEGDPGNLNAYAYVLNRPTGLTDPTGAFAFDAFASGSGFSGLGREGGGGRGGDEDPPPPEEKQRPDGESRDPRGKGLPQLIPPPNIPTPATREYAALAILPDGSVPGTEKKVAEFPVTPGGALASSRALGRALEAVGISRPAGAAAHHIVAGRAPGAAAARAILKRFGIGINNAENGVFLSRTASSVSDAAVHAGGHKETYYRAVNQALATATNREQAIRILNSIGEALKSGRFPW